MKLYANAPVEAACLPNATASIAAKGGVLWFLLWDSITTCLAGFGVCAFARFVWPEHKLLVALIGFGVLLCLWSLSGQTKEFRQRLQTAPKLLQFLHGWFTFSAAMTICMPQLLGEPPSRFLYYWILGFFAAFVTAFRRSKPSPTVQ
jgi:uncharacterized membrane protein YfcA